MSVDEPVSAEGPRPHAPGVAPAQAWYALGVILVAYVLSFIDRTMLNLLVEPIKRDLALSDTQFSFLQGLSFALFLSVSAFPMGRLIDVGRRTSILAGGVTFWSLATMACGMASGFRALLLARIGVGVGESVMTPTALSMIGDLFPPQRMGLATSLYALGVHLGSGLALLSGARLIAWVPHHEIVLPGFGPMRGWQLIFLAISLPGVPIALWAASLPEPLRDRFALERSSARWRDLIALLRSSGWALTYANLSVAFAAMSVYGIGAWLPSFFIRHHGWTAAHIGTRYGVAVIVSGVLGVLAAGLCGDRMQRRGWADSRLRLMGAASLCAAPLALLAPMQTSPSAALWLFALANFLMAAAVGSGPAILQELTPARLRGSVHALALLTVNLIALGLGPTSIAVTTDYIFHDEGAVGRSLAVVPPLLLLLSAAFAAIGRLAYLRIITVRQNSVTIRR